jgi:hypothetical protein
MDKIKKGTNIEHLSEEERKKIRTSFDPDNMGFEYEDLIEGGNNDSNK